MKEVIIKMQNMNYWNNFLELCLNNLNISYGPNPLYPATLTTFEKKLNFVCPKRPFWTVAAPKCDMLWYKILRPSFFLEHWSSFMSRWPLLRGGGRILHIRSWETTNFWFIEIQMLRVSVGVSPTNLKIIKNIFVRTITQ